MARRLSALAVAMAAATTMAAPAPEMATAGVPMVQTTSQPQARQQATTTPAVRTVVSRAQFIPMVNMPYSPRREPIWLGRPRDRGGKPWGSRHGR